MADQSAKWQQDQRNKAKAHKPKVKKSQIPGNYGCAGDCAESTPPAPGADMEMFRVYNSVHHPDDHSNREMFRVINPIHQPDDLDHRGRSTSFWLVVGTATAVYLALTLSKSNIAIRYR